MPKTWKKEFNMKYTFFLVLLLHWGPNIYNLIRGQPSSYSGKIPIITNVMTGKNVGLTSRWFSPEELHKLVATADPGDLLEMPRGVYSHWALYAGVDMSSTGHQEAYVVHFVKGKRLTKPTIDVTKLVIAVGESKVRINNNFDNTYSITLAKDITAINERIKDFIREIDQYDVVDSNCEHFVSFCRYGLKLSFQSGLLPVIVILAGVFTKPVSEEDDDTDDGMISIFSFQCACILASMLQISSTFVYESTLYSFFWFIICFIGFAGYLYIPWLFNFNKPKFVAIFWVVSASLVAISPSIAMTVLPVIGLLSLLHVFLGCMVCMLCLTGYQFSELFETTRCPVKKYFPFEYMTCHILLVIIGVVKPCSTFD